MSDVDGGGFMGWLSGQAHRGDDVGQLAEYFATGDPADLWGAMRSAHWREAFKRARAEYEALELDGDAAIEGAS